MLRGLARLGAIPSSLGYTPEPIALHWSTWSPLRAFPEYGRNVALNPTPTRLMKAPQQIL